MIKSVEIGILTPTRLSEPEMGREFLGVLKPPFSPEKYGAYEPIRTLYDELDLSGPLSIWGGGFLWARSKPRVSGQVVMGGRGIHDAVYVSLPLGAFELDATLELLAEFDTRFKIDIAYIHLRSSLDTQDIGVYKNCIMPFSQGLSTQDLLSGLPDLAWGTSFGHPYQKIFGDELEAAPAHSTIDVGGTIFVQITEDISDVDRHREAYLAAKQAIKSQLDNNAFRSKGGHGPCNVPDFRLDRISPP